MNVQSLLAIIGVAIPLPPAALVLGAVPAAERDRPHLTFALVPSTSTPFAHASAARSASLRSLKLTNAHRLFSTWTTDFTAVGGIKGMELRRAVRTDDSVALAGSDDINREV